MANRKSVRRDPVWSEAEFRARVIRDGLRLPPVTLQFVPEEPPAGNDAIVEAEWGGHRRRYIVEYRPRNTLKPLDAAIGRLRRGSEAGGLSPLLVIPYFSEDGMERLAQEGISGIDLCGNGVLIAPNFSVWRSGQPNRFLSSQTIKNVYSGDSSLLARSFLLRAEYASLTALQQFALARLPITDMSPRKRGLLTKGTVSKVVRTLGEDLLVSIEAEGVRLIDGSRLLRALSNNYTFPSGYRVRGKTGVPVDGMWGRLKQAAGSVRYVATGLASAGHYGLLSETAKLSLYVSDVAAVARILDFRETPVLPTIELIEAEQNMVYFDCRRQGEAVWASPLQTYLELTHGGGREQQAAAELSAVLTAGRGENVT